MNQDKYVFAQLVTFPDRNHFNYLVRKYSGDRYVKHFTCWDQLLVMMFGQLTNRESLRDLIVIIEAHRIKCYHLGLGKHVTKSNLAKANQNRDCRIFKEFAYFLVAEARSKRITDIFKLGGSVYAFDSKDVLSDATITLTGYYPSKHYPEPLWLVRFWDAEQEREFSFLTNAFHLSSLQVAELYKNRWQVELFFKWLKQHLKIKKFWGTTENAVRIQIYSAICDCLVAIVQHDLQLKRSTYEVLQILGVSLTDKTPLYDLFNNNQLNYFKKLNYSNGQFLLNF